MPIGLAHRCVHCTMKIYEDPISWKTISKTIWFQVLAPHTRWTWTPHKLPIIHSWTDSVLINFDRKRTGKYLGSSWCETWHFKAPKIAFAPSGHLQHSRVLRRQIVEQDLRKDLSLQIRQIHPQKLKRWKTNHLNVFLGIPNWWKDLSVIICPGLPDDAVWHIHAWMILRLCWRGGLCCDEMACYCVGVSGKTSQKRKPCFLFLQDWSWPSFFFHGYSGFHVCSILTC